IRIEHRHQPAGRRVLHPGADVGDDGRDPKDRERRMTERRPCGRRGGGFSASLWTAHRLPKSPWSAPFASTLSIVHQETSFARRGCPVRFESSLNGIVGASILPAAIKAAAVRLIAQARAYGRLASESVFPV